MKVIYKIAKAELRQLFCSPIAWLILIIFTVQSGITFVENMESTLMQLDTGSSVSSITERVFLGWKGVFTIVQRYLYLYIPLLTMGLISKEKSSGSIKLLFSSPINNVQIVFGKYAAMLMYTFVLIAVLLIYALFGYFTIDKFDFPYIASAMLGLFLLTCSYAAVGLFMSTLTSYQVVAAVATLALLTVLNLIGEVGQDIPIVRDVAYWLSLRGRSNDMLNGLIGSEDVIYFLIIIAVFILLSIMKLNNERNRLKPWIIWARYAMLLVIAFALGQISRIPHLMLFYDATFMKQQTLLPESQKPMEMMEGPLTITTYVNLLDPFYSRAMPDNLNNDKKMFRYFTRFKPEMKFDYVYYWDTADNPALSYRLSGLTDQQKVNQLTEELLLDPDMFKSPSEFQKPEEVIAENNRFTRILERGNGEKTILRLFGDRGDNPKESHIAAAMKRLVVGPSRVAFLTGHGERGIYRIGEQGYYNITVSKYNADAMVNNGFDVFELNLKEQRLDTIDVDILVISQMKEAFTEDELMQIKNYLAIGGNLFIACEPGSQDFMNPILEEFGVKFLPGRIMQNNPDVVSNLVLARPTKEAQKLWWKFRWMNRYNYKAPMFNAVAIDHSDTDAKGIEKMVIMSTDSVGYWNELTNIAFTETQAEFNPELGEIEDCYTLALRLNRQIGEKEQRIMVFADSDWFSNGELSTRRNGINSEPQNLLTYTERWLTYDEYPLDDTRFSSPDTKMYITGNSVFGMKLVFWSILPIIMIGCCMFIQITRKRN